MKRFYTEPDYFYKSYIITNYPELIKQVALSSKLSYSKYKFETTGEINWVLQKCNGLPDYQELKNMYSGTEEERRVFKECRRLNDASFKRVIRLRNRIDSIVQNNEKVVFITLTFNDETLSRTDEKQRRKLVSRFLKEIGCEYVANIDYGKLNERVHYHGVVALNDYLDPKSNKWAKNYGFLSLEKVWNNSNRQLARYTNKLTNHAIKESCKRVCLIYSR